MSDQRRATRRTSARLTEKENVNGSSSHNPDADDSRAAAKPKGAVKSKAGRAAASAKRKQDYDEEDDGFLFTRKKTKRVKSAQPDVPEPVAEEESQRPEVPDAQTDRRKGRKRLVDDESLADRDGQAQEGGAPKRRAARGATTEETSTEPAPLEMKKKRRSKAKTPDAETAEQPLPERGRSRQSLEHARATPVASQGVATKIALPFADTPIIRRNQEMRKGKEGARRSSLGNRGRRASSLIDSGRSSALPHEHVGSAEFFKHIESGLPEPRRMKQLLTWCATRAFGERNKRGTEAGGKDATVRMAAREIQQQILKDFTTRSELSDWFGREESTAAKAASPAVKKPNPRNVANQVKIKELEQQLQTLQSERATWERILRPPNKAPLLAAPPSKLPDLATLDPSLLTTSNASILERLRDLQLCLAPKLQEETKTKLDTATKDIEFQTDQLADNVHILAQYRLGAEKLATQVLNDAATALEVRSRKERERSGTEEVGVRDVLRGLSRVEQRQ